MARWTIEQAKRDFSMGYLSGYSLHRFQLENSYWLVYLIDDHKAEGPLVDARNREPRRFKTLDSAVNAIEQCGFSVDALVKL